jgi:hypothetical protein
MCIPCMNKCHTHGQMKWHRVGKELKLGKGEERNGEGEIRKREEREEVREGWE